MSSRNGNNLEGSDDLHKLVNLLLHVQQTHTPLSPAIDTLVDTLRSELEKCTAKNQAAAISCEQESTLVKGYLASLSHQRTQSGYGHAIEHFRRWCAHHDLLITQVELENARQYIDDLAHEYANTTLDSHLAAIRGLYKWLIKECIVRNNPVPQRHPQERKGVVLTQPLCMEDLHTISVRLKT